MFRGIFYPRTSFEALSWLLEPVHYGAVHWKLPDAAESEVNNTPPLPSLSK
jgi:hypothetical protein